MIFINNNYEIIMRYLLVDVISKEIINSFDTYKEANNYRNNTNKTNCFIVYYTAFVPRIHKNIF